MDIQIKMVDSIVNSLDSILQMLVLSKSEMNDDILHYSIEQILSFLNKLIDSFPNLVVGDRKYILHKDTLMKLCSNLNEYWITFQVLPNDFLTYWNLFKIEWEEAKLVFTNFKNFANLIYISLN
ncbi:MAG TPA: hypothetical protein PLE30_08490 [Candidatus Kapabacteria bacterium]|nr:hypothetical protein [Candidatus Kapabacteria bacterium]